MDNDLKVGSKIKDNDPRGTGNRILTVVELLPNGVIAKGAGGRGFTLLRRRIYTDGKPRRSGFSLVP